MKNTKVDALKMMLEIAADQLIMNVSVLGLASDVVDVYDPKLKQVFETMIEQTSCKITKIQKTLKEVQ